MVTLNSKSDASASSARRRLDPWIAVAIVVILLIALVLIVLHIHKIEHPWHSPLPMFVLGPIKTQSNLISGW